MERIEPRHVTEKCIVGLTSCIWSHIMDPLSLVGFFVAVNMSQSLVLRYFWVTTRLKIKSNKLMNILF